MRLAFDERLRHGERRALPQPGQRLRLDARVDGALQLEPEVRVHFLAQVVHAAARDAEPAGKRLVERRHLGFRDLVHRQCELRFLPRDLAAMVVGRKRERERLRAARRHARHRRLEFGEHAALAEHDRKVACLAARKLDAVDHSGEVDAHAIARLRRPLDRMIGRALPAQHVERSLHVRRRDFGDRPRDRDLAHLADLHVRINLEYRREFERVRGGFGVLRALDPRRAGDAQVLRPHRVVERRLNALGDHVRANLGSVLLVEKPKRRFAGTESGHPDGAGKPREALLHFAFDVGDRHRDAHAAREVTQRFHGVLHA